MQSKPGISITATQKCHHVYLSVTSDYMLFIQADVDSTPSTLDVRLCW